MKKKNKPAKPKGVSIERADNGKDFFVHVVHKNGNILHASETLKRKQSAFKNILASAHYYFNVLTGMDPVIDEAGNEWYYTKKKRWECKKKGGAKK